MKNKVLKILLLIAGLTTACSEFDHTNPFDANCDIDWTPKNLQVEVINNSKIKLTWEQHIEQISGFRISRKTNNNEFTQIAEVKLKNIGNIKLNETEFIDTNLIVGNFYIYQIKAWADQFETDNLSSIEIHFDFDCNDIYQGDATVDECGDCDSDSTNDCIQDCAGVGGGNATVDECGDCDSDSTNDCIQDCIGVWGGTHWESDCGCVAIGNSGDACDDCFGIPNGTAIIDCAGVCNGNALIDECVVCDGGNADQDCAGVCFGDSALDDCGVCDNDTTNDCIQDCAGVWGGTHWESDCGCVSINSSCVTDYDGNSYETIIIGEQEWMSENLKVAHYQNGDPITNITNNGDWGSYDEGQYGVYNNDPSYADIYGNLYNWAVVDDERGVCPDGWHVPSDEEYKILEMYLGMSQSEADAISWRGTNEGSKLAGNASLWNDGGLESNVEFGTSGFSGIPSGYRYFDNGYYYGIESYGYFWSSTEYGSGTAWNRRLGYSDTGVYRSNNDKQNGFSVRCVR